MMATFQPVKNRKANSQPFVPPRVRVGDIVYYYHGKPLTFADDGDLIGDREPTAAHVAKLASQPGMLHLTAIEPDAYTLRVFDEAVRHIDDPRLLHDLGNDTERGFWTLRPADENALTPQEIAELRTVLLGGKTAAAA
jgi:hypothetical protein